MRQINFRKPIKRQSKNKEPGRLSLAGLADSAFSSFLSARRS